VSKPHNKHTHLTVPTSLNAEHLALSDEVLGALFLTVMAGSYAVVSGAPSDDVSVDAFVEAISIIRDIETTSASEAAVVMALQKAGFNGNFTDAGKIIREHIQNEAQSIAQTSLNKLTCPH